MKKYTCPCCDKELTPEVIEQIVKDAIHSRHVKIGSVKTPKKSAASRAHIAKVNASLTPEKRKKAAAKIPPAKRREKAINAVTARWAKRDQAKEGN